MSEETLVQIAQNALEPIIDQYQLQVMDCYTNPKAFGSGWVTLGNSTHQLKIINDRGEIFIDIISSEGNRDLAKILKEITGKTWIYPTGKSIEEQLTLIALDIQRHKNLLF